MRAFAMCSSVCLLTWAQACGSTPAPVARPKMVRQPVVEVATTESKPPVEPPPTTQIRGLRGTLNRDDIHQAMNARADALTACSKAAKRRARYLDGEIKFAFKVDAEGKPFDVRAVESSVGNQSLQDCFTGVLAETEFPRPAGRTATRDFQWSMSVYPSGRSVDFIDSEVMQPILKEKAWDAYKECKLARRRNRFNFTLYVAPNGRIISQGAVITRGKKKAVEALPCMQEQVQDWRLPRQKRRSKVNFDLR